MIELKKRTEYAATWEEIQSIVNTIQDNEELTIELAPGEWRPEPIPRPLTAKNYTINLRGAHAPLFETNAIKEVEVKAYKIPKESLS